MINVNQSQNLFSNNTYYNSDGYYINYLDWDNSVWFSLCSNGTCYQYNSLPNQIIENDPDPLKLINITTSRNFYGRQIDSFVEKILFENENFEAIFIRAPKIVSTEKDIEILSSTHDGTPVAVKSKNILGTSFHPELTDDLRIHKMFLDMTKNK